MDVGLHRVEENESSMSHTIKPISRTLRPEMHAMLCAVPLTQSLGFRWRAAKESHSISAASSAPFGASSSSPAAAAAAAAACAAA